MIRTLGDLATTVAVLLILWLGASLVLRLIERRQRR